jgi:predicted dehydrogenase
MKTINVGMIGYAFMGKAHSNAWLKVAKFFDLPAMPVMKAVCGRHGHAVTAFAKKWGWQSVETNWRRLIARDDIDLVDICTPNSSHSVMAIAAAKAGKHIACEKPLGMDADDARKMLAAVKAARVKNTVWFNYRRTPALSLAKRLIDEGRIGEVYHVRAAYLQDWIMDPDFPLVWRLKKAVAGSGAHGDLNAHIIDMAYWLVGRIESVTGMTKTFITKRPIAPGARKKGNVTVDDAALFLARFENGAVGSFEATRFAGGRKNANQIEINGSKGTLVFSFERMNELQFLDRTAPLHLQGFTNILVTEPVHPYIKAWWPGGHIIGYEHTFANQMSDIVSGIAKNRKLSPDFADGVYNNQVLDAVLASAKSGSWVKVARM